jgi:hypothetical protein
LSWRVVIPESSIACLGLLRDAIEDQWRPTGSYSSDADLLSAVERKINAILGEVALDINRLDASGGLGTSPDAYLLTLFGVILYFVLEDGNEGRIIWLRDAKRE